MILRKNEIMQAFKFLKPAIGGNESRKNLMVVNVEYGRDDYAILTAANSFIIKRVKLETIESKMFYTFNINKPAICTFEKICRIEKNIRFAGVSSSILSCGDFGLKYKQQETDFPNLEKLLSTDYKSQPIDNYSGLSHYLLEDCLYGFPNESKREVLKVWFKGKDSPVKIQSQCGNYTAMIMPVRINW